jgi:hypothetical protein
VSLGSASRAGTALLPGDILVANKFQQNGGGTEYRVQRVDPVTGARTTVGSTSDIGAFLVDLDVDALGRIYAIAGVSVYRFQSQSYDALDPSHNRELVSSGGELFSQNGVDVGYDGLLYVAGQNPNSAVPQIVRVDPALYDPQHPHDNQQVVALGGLLTGIAYDVAIDAVSGRLYVTTSDDLVRIDPDAYNASDPSANQEDIANPPLFGWGGPLTLEADRRVVTGGGWRVDPSICVPVQLCEVTSVTDASGATGIALEVSGSLLLAEAFGPDKLLRVFPAAYDPDHPKANQHTLVAMDPLAQTDEFHGVAVMPEPDFMLAGSSALLALGLAWRRAFDHGRRKTAAK